MKAKKLIALGVPRGAALKAVLGAMPALAAAGLRGAELRALVASLVREPEAFSRHPQLGQAARAMTQVASQVFVPREPPAPWRQWGEDLEPLAVEQLRQACSLPVSVAGALMPDAHLGYGLPIGGVLATRGVVIPYAVGVDIACRMRMSVLDWPVEVLDQPRRARKLVQALERETRFGLGASFERGQRRQHAVMDRDWTITAQLRCMKDKAWQQLGSSGSGNHFAEFGVLTVGGGLAGTASWEEGRRGLGLEPGRYLALLTHSGSRGTGAEVARYFSSLAAKLHPELPRQLKRLAWLDLGTEDGQAYWAAMTLMGDYAAANHELIHAHVTERLGARILASVENHHNFAWIEQHDGQQVVVHRKGATPAGRGVLGVIPGSMGTAGYVVRGLGEPDSLNSASHGAGRAMSRKAARRLFNWKDAREFLRKRRVKLISGGLDEVPMAYKDIHEVMAAQRDLVEPLARFDPRLVKMAPE